MEQISINAENFQAVHTAIENVQMDGKMVLRVVKSEKLDRPDEDTYARLIDSNFHNGTICVEMRSRLLPDAPDYARGFIGIVFRTNENDAEFESYYVRPTNGRHPDPVRRAHGSQYFSYPGYTFSYFREHDIFGFEAPCDIGLDEWIMLKAVVKEERASFYVNNMDVPVLVVDHLKHGADASGGVGVYVDIGTEGFFRNFQVICED